MIFRSLCCAYLLFFSASVAQGESRRALEMAECGYLTALVVEQMSELDPKPEALDEVIQDVVDFTNLYYVISNRDRPAKGNGITFEMYRVVTDEGRAIHERRIAAISEKNSLKLSNKVLQQCRTDLRLLGAKLLHG